MSGFMEIERHILQLWYAADMWEQENTCSRVLSCIFYTNPSFLWLLFIWTLALYLVSLALLGYGGLLCGYFFLSFASIL